MLKIIIGLGNPGKTYENTRHNVGKLFLDFLTIGENWKLYKKINVETIEHNGLILIKPLCFMNESGVVIKNILDSYRAKPENTLIVQDDSDLIFGKIKFAEKTSSSAGHHGIESIEKMFGKKKFKRIRIGIRPPSLKATGRQALGKSWIKAETFVLKKFSKKDSEILEKDVFPKAKELLIEWIGKSE